MIVVDASAIVDALVDPGDGEALRRRLADDALHAPALIDYEVTHAARGMTLRGVIDEPRAHALLADFDDLPIHRWAAAHQLRRSAFRLRGQLSAYDAAYVALAEALDCVLVTRDARLGRTTGHGARIEVL